MQNQTAVTAPANRPTLERVALVACGSCGATMAPDGSCMEVGTCADADARAVRGAARQTSKYAVPAAWNARGSVD